MNILHKNTQSSPKLHADQKGMASILVTMVLMIVLSLIVLGFAQLSRRNQRQTLDRQLSTQAFYSAESAINGVRSLVNTALQNGTSTVETIPPKTNCQTDSTGFYSSLIGANATLDAAHGVSYSCLLVNPAPSTLEYSDIASASTIVPLVSADGSNFKDLTLTWQPKNTANLASCPTTTNSSFAVNSAATWGCGYGVMRFDLVSVAGALDSSSLQTSAMTTFAEPLNNVGTNTTAFTANGNAMVGVKCSAVKCVLTVQNLVGPAAAQSNKFYMRINTIYKDGPLQIAATNTAGTAIKLLGAQMLVDATGKSQDVLRRIQVRVPLAGNTSTNQLPDSALQSTDSICKRYAVMDGYFKSDTSSDGSNELCQ